MLTQMAVVKGDSVRVQSIVAVAIALFYSHDTVSVVPPRGYCVTSLGRWGWAETVLAWVKG